MTMGSPDESPRKGDEMGLHTTESNGTLGEAANELYHIDPVKERRMMRKFDVCEPGHTHGQLIDCDVDNAQLYAIVGMGILYMMSNLDRSNLGNANIAGMPEEIGLIGNQFGIATTLL